MKKILEVKNVYKIYKMYKKNFDRIKEVFLKRTYHAEHVANKDITFDLYEGETLGIIGVNGAGKSTILKIIAGVIDATSGYIARHGKVTALLELGTGFNAELTGYENIYLNGTLIGMNKSEIDTKLEKIIAFSELKKYIYEPIKTYSSGMKMRLAFSIAIFSNPKILIVDEALSVGDAHFSAKCTKALKDRKKNNNMSIIYVSHNLNSLKILCDRVLLLNQGSVENIGEPESIIAQYNYLISKLNDTDDLVQIQDSKAGAFGNLNVEITQVSIESEISNSSVITTGEEATLQVNIKSNIEISDMTVGFIIKDKFGQDIFGTNTFHHQKTLSFEKNKSYVCSFKMTMNLGHGKYTITAAVHSGENHLQECSHWIDNAQSFEVISADKEHFIGLCRLEPKINFKEI